MMIIQMAVYEADVVSFVSRVAGAPPLALFALLPQRMQVDPIIDYLVRSRDAVQAAIDDPAFCRMIADIAEVAAEALRAGGKLLLVCNGGSAADAQHIAGELRAGSTTIGRRSRRSR